MDTKQLIAVMSLSAALVGVIYLGLNYLDQHTPKRTVHKICQEEVFEESSQHAASLADLLEVLNNFNNKGD